jgi:hypothetical protein
VISLFPGERASVFILFAPVDDKSDALLRASVEGIIANVYLHCNAGKTTSPCGVLPMANVKQRLQPTAAHEDWLVISHSAAKSLIQCREDNDSMMKTYMKT